MRWQYDEHGHEDSGAPATSCGDMAAGRCGSARASGGTTNRVHVERRRQRNASGAMWRRMPKVAARLQLDGGQRQRTGFRTQRWATMTVGHTMVVMSGGSHGEVTVVCASGALVAARCNSNRARPMASWTTVGISSRHRKECGDGGEWAASCQPPCPLSLPDQMNIVD